MHTSGRSYNIFVIVGGIFLNMKGGFNAPVTGRSLHCQAVNHVQTKFATPILYAIDHFKNYDSYSTYITIDNIFCIFF
jgi:hypothetical protein